jgi:hypothetical protein
MCGAAVDDEERGDDGRKLSALCDALQADREWAKSTRPPHPAAIAFLNVNVSNAPGVCVTTAATGPLSGLLRLPAVT